MEELMNVLRSQKQSFLENREIVMKEMGTDFKKQYEEVTSQIEEMKKMLESKDLKDYERMNLKGDIAALEEERREMKSQINARIRRKETGSEAMNEEVEQQLRTYEKLEEEMEEQIRGYEEIDEGVEQLMRTYMELSDENKEEAMPVKLSKAKPKAEMAQNREMSETEKMYHEMEQKIKEAEEKLETRSDPEVREMLKRGIAGLEEKRKALEMKMKETGVEFVSILEDREKRKGIEQIIKYYEKLEEEMNEQIRGYAGINEEVEETIQGHAGIDKEEQLKEDEKITVGISKVKVKAEVPKQVGFEIEEAKKHAMLILGDEFAEAYNEVLERINKEKEMLKRKSLSSVQIYLIENELKRDIVKKFEMNKILVSKIAESKNIRRDERSKIKRTKERLEKKDFQKYAEQMMGEDVGRQTLCERKYQDAKISDSEKERMEQKIEKEIRNYAKKHTVEFDKIQKKEEFPVKPIVGRLEGESVKDRMKRAIKGYVKVNDDMAKLGKKELVQSARYNLKQFGYRMKGNLVYAAQILGETQDAKNFKALWQDFKESETAKKIRGVVKEVSQKEVVQDMMQGTKGAMDEMKQGAKKVIKEMEQDAKVLAKDMKHDMKKFGKDFMKTTQKAVKEIPGRVKETAQTGWGNFAYTMQEVDKATEPLREKMKQYEVVQKAGRVVQNVSQSKVVRKTNKGVKKVLQKVKQEIKASKNIKGFARNMKNKIFKNLREYCPITINREAKSVQVVEYATKTVMLAGSQSVLGMRSAAEDSARKLILGLGDKIEGKTNEKEAIMQKKQKDLEREERCK